MRYIRFTYSNGYCCGDGEDEENIEAGWETVTREDWKENHGYVE